MSPDIPLKIVEWFFQFGLIGFLLGMMALYAIFRGWHYYRLLSGESEKHKAVFDEAKQLVRSEHWGTRYRLFLQKVLSKLTGMIGDGYRFPDMSVNKPRVRADHPALEQMYKDASFNRECSGNPFTVESYKFCLMIALVYPILGLIVSWGIGGVSLIGGFEAFPIAAPLENRIAITLSLALCLAFYLYAFNSVSRLVEILLATVALIFAVPVYIIGVDIGAFVLLMVVASLMFFSGITGAVNSNTALIIHTVAISASTTSGGAITDTSVDVSLVAMIIMTHWIIYSVVMSLSSRGLAIQLLMLNVMLLSWSLVAFNWAEPGHLIFILLFLLIFPLINTPLDWLSLGITRKLLHSIQFRQHRFRKALVWSLLDLGLALLALLLVSGVIVSLVSLVNLLAIEPIIDLEAVFTSLGSLDNWRDNLWIYFMLLSTLVPTAIHFALAGGALTLAVSDKQRRAILKDMDSNDLSAKKAWIYVSVMPAFGFVLTPTLLLFSLYWILHAHGAFLGDALLSWTKLLATWIDPTLGQLPKLIGA